jgi:hypothetical protein
MKNDPIQEIQVAPTDILTIEHPEDDEDESVGDYHRQAAYHFSAAAKHHLKAADADEDGDEQSLIVHAHLAYRHQLNGTQYAEIAAMESDLESDQAEADEVASDQKDAD